MAETRARFGAGHLTSVSCDSKAWGPAGGVSVSPDRRPIEPSEPRDDERPRADEPALKSEFWERRPLHVA